MANDGECKKSAHFQVETPNIGSEDQACSYPVEHSHSWGTCNDRPTSGLSFLGAVHARFVLDVRLLAVFNPFAFLF